MSLTMFDSTTVTDIPTTGMDAVAGYVGGNWPTFKALVARFPHVPALSIAVTSSQDARMLDVEKGDATPADVSVWLDRQTRLRPTETPILYCPASSITAVRAAAGNRRYLLMSAHYGAGQHICGPGACQFPRADATQWDDHGPKGEHYDRTAMTPAFLAAFAPPAPPAASSIPAVFRKVIRAVIHATGLGSEKPWGMFPLKDGGWYGLNDGTAKSHSGAQVADQRAVKQIQREVGVLADGGYGAKTAAAVALWQRAHGLRGDGCVGVLTWNAMTRA